MLAKLGFEQVMNLDNLTSEGGGRGVHMALAFLLNEAVEMPRFLFVAGTLKPVRARESKRFRNANSLGKMGMQIGG